MTSSYYENYIVQTVIPIVPTQGANTDFYSNYPVYTKVGQLWDAETDMDNMGKYDADLADGCTNWVDSRIYTHSSGSRIMKGNCCGSWAECLGFMIPITWTMWNIECGNSIIDNRNG